MRVRFLGREDPPEEGMQPPPVFWPGESHRHRSLAGYSLWVHKESDTTEVTQHACMPELYNQGLTSIPQDRIFNVNYCNFPQLLEGSITSWLKAHILDKNFVAESCPTLLQPHGL